MIEVSCAKQRPLLLNPLGDHLETETHKGKTLQPIKKKSNFTCFAKKIDA
jgi:hypothetical protein